MKIATEQQNNVMVIKVEGSLDAETVQGFKARTAKLVEEKCFKVVLDFSRLEFVDSMGLGAMISLLRRVRSNKGDVKIAAPTKDVMSVFEITRLHYLFEIFPTVALAIEKF